MAVTLLDVIVSECRTATDFKCDNNLCLPKSVKCDGYDQCGDGSDENELCGAFWCFLLSATYADHTSYSVGRNVVYCRVTIALKDD